MKQNKFFLPILLFFIVRCFVSSAQERVMQHNDTVIVLQITGQATENYLPLDGVNVILYKENEEMEWNFISEVPRHSHNFSFDLYGNSIYTIMVTKEGYFPRCLTINTTVPSQFIVDDDNPPRIFEFPVEVFKKNDKVDDYYFDFPVSIIEFNMKKAKFEYNEKYSQHIREKVYRTLGLDPNAPPPTPKKK